MPLTRKFSQYVFGYVVAVISAAFVTTAVYSLTSRILTKIQFQSDGKPILSFAFPFTQYFEVTFTGIMYTAIFGLPGFLIAMVIAKHMNWKSVWIFTAAGFANGAFAHLLVFLWLDEYIFLWIVCSMTGGALGGALYWLVSGRKLSIAQERKVLQ